MISGSQMRFLRLVLPGGWFAPNAWLPAEQGVRPPLDAPPCLVPLGASRRPAFGQTPVGCMSQPWPKAEPAKTLCSEERGVPPHGRPPQCPPAGPQPNLPLPWALFHHPLSSGHKSCKSAVQAPVPSPRTACVQPVTRDTCPTDTQHVEKLPRGMGRPVLGAPVPHQAQSLPQTERVSFCILEWQCLFAPSTQGLFF